METFCDVKVDCPYGMPHTAIYRQARFMELPADTLELFLAEGFRRNGNYIYTMRCRDCRACVPIRLDSDTFRPNRTQRRVWRRNLNLRAGMAPLHISNDKLALCDKFFRRRFPDHDNSALEYYAGFFINSLGYTEEVEFRQDGRLLAVSIVDIYENAINCVYFYFDPDESRRSLGIYNILYLMDYARQHGIKYVYLGLYIEDIAAMNYKAGFRPYYLLQHGRWQQVG